MESRSIGVRTCKVESANLPRNLRQLHNRRAKRAPQLGKVDGKLRIAAQGRVWYMPYGECTEDSTEKGNGRFGKRAIDELDSSQMS